MLLRKLCKETSIYTISPTYIQEGEYEGELARRSIGRFDRTVKLLRFNNHIVLTNDIDSFFKSFRVLVVTLSSEYLSFSTNIFREARIE